MKKKLQCQFNQIPVGTKFFYNGDTWIKRSTRTAHYEKDEGCWFWFQYTVVIAIHAPELDWTSVNADQNGNSRSVVHYLSCCPESWKEDPDKVRYLNVCKLMNQIGGAKFNNKQFGGGIVFQTSISGAEYIEHFIAKKIMEVDAENGFTY